MPTLRSYKPGIIICSTLKIQEDLTSIVSSSDTTKVTSVGTRSLGLVTQAIGSGRGGIPADRALSQFLPPF